MKGRRSRQQIPLRVRSRKTALSWLAHGQLRVEKNAWRKSSAILIAPPAPVRFPPGAADRHTGGHGIHQVGFRTVEFAAIRVLDDTQALAWLRRQPGGPHQPCCRGARPLVGLATPVLRAPAQSLEGSGAHQRRGRTITAPDRATSTATNGAQRTDRTKKSHLRRRSRASPLPNRQS